MRDAPPAHDLFKYHVTSRDGAAGHVHDLYFDDHGWRVRYVVVDVHHGLSHRQVLISPVCVRYVDPVQRRLDVSLGREQILRGPGVDADRPVSRQHEVALHEYYGIPFYWADEDPATPRGHGDPHLQSMRAVRGYTVITRDAAAGHVVDFVVDCTAWTVTGIVVARRHWLAGPRLVMPVSAVEHVSWLGKAVYLQPEAVGRTA
ncbi:MAG TPA: PRC-barrel domain-containing protein [Methylomirabilota bacterium]